MATRFAPTTLFRGLLQCNPLVVEMGPRGARESTAVPRQALTVDAPSLATRLLDGVMALGVPWQHERSFRMAQGSLLSDRFLLSLNRSDLGADAQQRTLALCQALGMPAHHLREAREAFDRAGSVHFGYEGGPGSAVCKFYLEDSISAQTALNAQARGEALLQYLAFKWDALRGMQAVTRYLWRPFLSVGQIRERLAALYAGENDGAGLAMALSVLELAAAHAPGRVLQYLELEEQGNPRRSFDLNLNDTGLRVRDIRQALVAMRERYAVVPEQFEALYEQVKDWPLGQLAGGVHRQGEDFFCIYHGAPPPRSGQADTAVALALQAQSLRGQGRHDEALAAFDAALSMQPHFPAAHYSRASLLQALQHHEEALAAYDCALAQRPDDAGALNNRGVVLYALGRHAQALDSYERALALQPDHALAHNNRGITLHALGRFDEAVASFGQALASSADFIEALSNRAGTWQASGRLQEALADCDVILRLAPDHGATRSQRAGVLLALGLAQKALLAWQQVDASLPTALSAVGVADALQALDRHEEALASYGRALQIDAGFAQAWCNQGNSLQALGRHAQAIESYAQAIALEPDNPKAHWNEALARLALGDYERGFEKYEWRWQHEGGERPALPAGTALWTGAQDVAGRRVLLLTEQGFGDAIQFVRYATRVAALGAHVQVACHSGLARLLRTTRGVEAVVSHEDEALPEADFYASVMSLPLAFGTRLHSIPSETPYLFVDTDAVQAWRARLAQQPRPLNVGLAWAGNPEFPGARAKRVSLDVLAPLVRLAQASPDLPLRLVILQKGESAQEAQRWGGVEVQFIDWSDELADFADTAALICALDLVVTVDTAVAHLAGALGRPVWILLPLAADWRWLQARDDSPWYPTARLYRQGAAGEWAGVVQRVVQDLTALAAVRREGGGPQ